jgi:hypothetical protein
MMTPEERALFVARVLESMENNPTSGATYTVRFEGGAGLRGTLLPWESLPHPAKDTRSLLQPLLDESRVLLGASFELENEEPGNWLVLFREDPDHPTEANTWEYIEGETETEAHEWATAGSRHWNYGRRGYHLLRVRTLPKHYTDKPL